MMNRSSSWSSASPGLALMPRVASPTPVSSSSVCSFRKTQFFHGLPTTNVCRPVILTFSLHAVGHARAHQKLDLRLSGLDPFEDPLISSPGGHHQLLSFSVLAERWLLANEPRSH